MQKADPVLGVEMASTGEVGCIGEDYYEAILKSMLSVGYAIPKSSVLLSTGDAKSKTLTLDAAKALQAKRYEIYATKGTANFLADNGVQATVVGWPDQDPKVSGLPNVLDFIKERKIDFVVNIPKNFTKDELNNDYTIRRSAIDFNIPLITNARLANDFIVAFCRMGREDLKIKAWNEYK